MSIATSLSESVPLSDIVHHLSDLTQGPVCGCVCLCRCDCGCGVWCVVWHAEKPPCVRSKRFPCVRSKRPRVYRHHAVSQQGRLSSHRLLPINHSKSSNFGLVSDQSLSHLKQVSQRCLGLFLGWSQILCAVYTKINCHVFTSRFFIWSIEGSDKIWPHNLHISTKYVPHMEKVFSIMRQIYGLSPMPEFPEATSFLVLVESSRKFRCSWSSSVATSFLVPNCIFLPSLKTRPSVLIVFSCVRFPCTWPICSTRCFEYPRAFRRNWILQSKNL